MAVGDATAVDASGAGVEDDGLGDAVVVSRPPTNEVETSDQHSP